MLYAGSLIETQDVLAWLEKQKSEDSIEEVTEEILIHLVKERGYVLAFFGKFFDLFFYPYCFKVKIIKLYLLFYFVLCGRSSQ